MTEHSETRIVPYTADLMYAVVADVERYPEFLPWVVALRIKSRVLEGQTEVLLAEMAVGYGALRERYTSDVKLDPGMDLKSTDDGEQVAHLRVAGRS